MAVITRYPYVRHARVEASSHLLVYRNGRLATSGRGIATWFLPQGATSLIEIPADDRDHVIAVSATTADFQQIGVQGMVSWRAVDPVRLAEHVDFTLDTVRGRYLAEPLVQVEAMVDGLVKAAVERHVAGRSVGRLLEDGIGPLVDSVDAALTESPRLAAIGVACAGVRLTDLTPSPELVRALRQPTIERLQQAADEAGFTRRAEAVAKEAAIAENELKAKIKLEEERARLIASEHDNGVARARTAAETARIEAEGGAEARAIAARAEAEALQGLEAVRLHAEQERAEIARRLPPVVVLSEALKQAFATAEIGTVNLGQDAIGRVGDLLAKAMRG